MTPECKEIVRLWLAKAQRDLDTADVLIHGERQLLDTGVYHCQQAAEKVLKGWLTSCGIEFLKIHDLTVLLASCVELDRTFERFQEAVVILTPYASAFRYPGDAFEPSLEEAGEALEMTRAIFQRVNSLLIHALEDHLNE